MRDMDANHGETPADVWELVRMLEARTRLAYCDCCEGVSHSLAVCSECGADGCLSEVNPEELRRDLLEDESKESRRRVLTGTGRDLWRATTICLNGGSVPRLRAN